MYIYIIYIYIYYKYKIKMKMIFLYKSPFARRKPLNVRVEGHFSNRNLLTLPLNAVRS